MRNTAAGGLAFLLVVASMMGAVEPAEADSHSEFVPVADSYVESHNPDTNYGSSTIVRTDASPVRTTYVKFNIQGEGRSRRRCSGSTPSRPTTPASR